MSEKQKDDLAWATRIITIALLGIASVVGMSVYSKVDEMYSEFSKQKEINANLKQADLDIRQDVKELSVEIANLKAQSFVITSKLNKNQ